MSSTENVSEPPATPATTPAVKKGFLNSKSVAFVSIISALGAVLSISAFTITFGPNISLDLSHIGTYIVAIGGGPILGAIAGSLVGIIPSMSPFIANAAMIPGKMLTGFSVGIIYFLLKRTTFFQKNQKLRFLAILIAGIAGYIPEMLFTIWDLYFIAFPPIMPPEAIMPTITGIMVKAWSEIVVITCLTAAIYSIKAVHDEVDGLIGKNASIGKIEYAVSGIIITLSMLFVIPFYITGLPKNQDVFIYLAYGLFSVLGVLIVYVVVNLRKK